MKKIYLLITAICLTSVSLFAFFNDDDKVIQFSETPSKVQEFVTTHFKGVEVIYVEEDRGSYELRLKNGVELDFNKKGDWKEIDANLNEMPESIIKLLPAKIVDYIKLNYKDRSIEKISSKRYGYKVDFKGRPDIELIFDKQGNFKRFDD